jgi:uncharacterized protein (DUF2147 family)
MRFNTNQIVLSVLLLIGTVQPLLSQGPPPVPTGLWQNKEEGFVMRIEACGDALCGFAAGAPNNPKKNEADVCGKQMLKSFSWNNKNQRWEGPMQPPNTNLKLNSSLSSDGKTYLVLKGKVLLVSKTLNFIPYTGKISAGCLLE